MKITRLGRSRDRLASRTGRADQFGLEETGILVNAVLLTSTATSLIRNITLEMIKRTGGAYESATIATALPGRMKMMAGRIAQQYRQVSPEKAPTPR